MDTKALCSVCIFVYLSSLVTSQSYQQNRWFNPNRQMRPRHVSQFLNPRSQHSSVREHHHQQNRRVRRMGMSLSGPNVCHQRGSSFCCPGWSVDNNAKTCTKPICEEGACGMNGICRRPNVCLCSSGRTLRECPPDESEQMRCNIRCMHGGECIDNECRCTYGYTGPHCGQAICGAGCLNGGRCIAPGRCACVYGFTGMRCERDYRKGPCFLTRSNSTCSNEIMSVMCTKLFCCATVGQGWGHPCEECPARVGNCTKGRMPPQCTDINECDVMPGLCERGMCVNTDGSFTCKCPDGFEHERDSHRCIDINECETSNVCAGGECANTEGGYECHCPPDSQLSNDGSYCVSDVPGRCFTAIESGMCASPLGNLVRRTTCCCLQSGQETLGKCFAAIGQFPERCATMGTREYERDCGGVEANTGLCDILATTACAHGRCVEQPEMKDYYCECDDGYQASPDNKKCVDVNECDVDLGQTRKICGSYGTCLNTGGSYRCHCSNGFENEPGNPTRCIDINECGVPNAQSLCENGACVNTRGSFICNCDDGFRVTATQQSCEDINECLESAGLCENGRCVNLVGDYRCICNPGFTASPDTKECLDNNECEKDNMCANGVCVNMEGMFKCKCNPGFDLMANGESCADINECLTNPCSNGRCQNNVGSFQCICHSFQVLDASGTRCVLEDETAQCYRSVRNGRCRPSNALTMDATRADCCCAVPGATSAWGDTCEPCPEIGDADYAVLCHNHEVSNICDLLENACENGHCLKMGNNRFRCVCDAGFLVSEDLRSCIDFDECTQSLCSNGVCRNTPGSYSCTCNDGFILSGDVCEDIDECLSNPCTNARCVNEPGAYRCVCEEGKQLDVSGHVCHDVRVGRCWLHYSAGSCMGSVGSKLMTVEECCNSVGQAWGNMDCTPCEDFQLKCRPGYSFDLQSNACINIRECDFGVCESAANCVDTEGSFQCICPPGYTLNSDGLTCSDLRVGTCFLELDSSGGCSGAGIGIGSFVISKANCCCSAGQAWGDDCGICPQKGTQSWNALCPAGLHSRNECIMFPDMCTNGVCKNTASSFMCECNRGFTLNQNGRNCTDINECQISPGLCGDGECVNIDGDFKCNCSEGYEASATMKVCMDINECSRGGFCTGGNCINTEGSYQCVCPGGRSVSDDGTSCVDVDECALRPDLCANGRCENMLGYFMCLCDAGYQTTPDGQSCVDVDECARNNGGCDMGCVNTQGSYECTCDEGFSLSFDQRTCADRDECMEQMNRCDGGRCENTIGAFRCICFDGFMSTSDLLFCEDIDECAMNPHVCMNGRCHNTRGSYTCSCEPGYCVPRDQMVCVDEDECELSKHNCHVNADCNNTDGGYECTCIQGFSGDGFMCHDDDECELGTHMCHEFADCRNKNGGYECDCREGFHGDGFSCSDTDDCLEDETLCGPHGECMNVDGSFECDCQMGFVTTLDRKACKDIDECAFEEVCVNGRCHNVPGAFRCACLDGFEMDEQGANCTDVDECLNVANCINGQCVNTQGSYQCQCPEGFELNPTGVGCVDNRVGDCFLHSAGRQNSPICTDAVGVGVSKAVCCCEDAAAWGNPCELCPQPNTTEYSTLCPGGVGFQPNPITVLLEDVDECRNLPGLCQGGQCINVFGSYICECSIGYQFTEETKTCEDVDECLAEGSGPSICGAGTCLNSVGGYNCACPEGYKSILGGRKCEDIRVDSCFRYFNETSLECSSDMFSQTKKVCCCYDNIGQGWNTPCERCPEPGTEEFSELCGAASLTAPADVCNTISNLCENGLCVPGVDGYRCECSLGYHFNEQLLICEDDNECVNEDMCFADAECVNQPGSYACACVHGFRFNEETEICEDIDECANGVCANGACANTRGGFKCDCNQGFQLVNNDTACEDINECDRNPCGNGVCNNIFGSFTCACDTGFQISDNGDCVDTDECEEEGQCGQGTCQNLPGTFACDCDDGYTVTPDGRNCIDTNECLVDPVVCGAGSCQNMDGSFKCYCPDGYSSSDQKSCDDIDECDADDYCKFGSCFNTPGSFRCQCPQGFELAENKKHCIDTREANCYFSYSSGVCSTALYRELTYGGCCCQCRNAGWGFEEGNCTACPRPDSFEFDDLCPNGCGYTPQGVDIDECRENPCVNGKCMNMAASFRCICMTGYTLDNTGVRCIDTDECETNSNACGRGRCENTDGSFECECEPGFYNGPTITCVDIDECRDDTLNHCGFRCENTLGSFHCACPQGFTLRSDGRMCEDLDECTSDTLNDCTAKGMTCKNVVGYYTCLCPAGYRRIGISDTCVDVDECDQIRVCTNGVCVNSDGSYSCECSAGYDYDVQNKMCLDTRQDVCYAAVHQRMCELTSTTGLMFTKAECCCNRGKGWGEDCEECPHPGTEAFLILCPHGMGFKPNGDDIDDCTVIPGLCVHGTCINTLGSYRCACDRGYESTHSKKLCTDVNECVATPSPCSFDCRNTEGSYECVCPAGYHVDQSGSSCVDLDECNTKRHNCQYVCINTVGSYKCECPHGFVQEDSQCVDKDECMDMPLICGPRGICRNDPGGYHCECPRGYRRGMGGECVDVDECVGGQGECSGSCQNVPGTYRCLCGRGYTSTLYGRGCQDVDECIRNPCGMGQSCSNNRGGYQCGCSRGLTKMGGGCGDVDECQIGGGSCQFGCQNTYGGFACSCPRGFFRLGSGHCIRGSGGFQQRIPHIPMYPGFGNQGMGRGPMGGYRMPQQPVMGMGQQYQRQPRRDTVCYSCMPGGDVPRRYRRSVDEAEGRFIEIHDRNGKATLNTTYPIEIFISRQNVSRRTTLLELRASMKQLRDNSRYQIVSGDKKRFFRIHHREQTSVLHLSKNAIDKEGKFKIEPAEYSLILKATTSLDYDSIRRSSFDSDTIQDAIEETVSLGVKIFLEE